MRTPQSRYSHQSRHYGWPLLMATALVGGAFQSLTALPVRGETTVVISNQATLTYTNAEGETVNGVSNRIDIGNTVAPVPVQIDPLTDCDGNTLTNFGGFKIALYEFGSDPTGNNPGPLVAMTTTEVPDNPGNSVPLGLAPNTSNANPFTLTTTNGYVFLLDPAKGQLDPGKTYILSFEAPPDSQYRNRKVKVTLGERVGNAVRYTAESLSNDKPFGQVGQKQSSVSGDLLIQSNGAGGLVAAAFSVNADVCKKAEIQLTLTSDRTQARINDVINYTLTASNVAQANLRDVEFTVTLPRVLTFVPNEENPSTIDAEFNGQTVTFTVSTSRNTDGSTTITFRSSTDFLFRNDLTGNPPLIIRFVGRLTSTDTTNPQPITATVNGVRVDNLTQVSDGPVNVPIEPLVDPLGQVTGCAGETLPDYNGFSVGVYEVQPSDPTQSTPGGLTVMTATELPDNPANAVPRGIAPNIQNSNPFFLTNGDRGTYNFLLDAQRGQLDKGKTYILVVQTPAGTIYNQRRVRLVIGDRAGTLVNYTAFSLDGKPISAADGRTSVQGVINIADAERVGLSLAVLQLNTSACQADEIQVLKTGDRAAAEPGDTVIYRLTVRNLSSAPLQNIELTDTLPLGIDFLNGSAKAELNGVPVPINATRNGAIVTLSLPGLSLPAATPSLTPAPLNIAYGAVVTPDALRGNGQNSVTVKGQRADNTRPVTDGPAIYRLQIRPGIISDSGTVIGRVFVDKNFDGEQQPNEPGIPNAVIYMDDGNRILTDANGLFSVSNVVAGYRSATLDLSSLPGYSLAPNLYFSERNSQSRLVHVAPGSMVRLNFGVTPAFQEAK